jgi:eukaryotic-like serine/threonine-protein kinase
MTLTPERMASLSRLLDEALPLDERGRRRWLQRLPLEHQDLADALRTALLSDADAIETLSTLPKILPACEARESAASGLTPGFRVGPYELLRLLGAGGMAEVWLARRADGAFKRDVALKLPLQSFRRELLAQRFDRERDILAVLEHPNIARLYDAGVDQQGLPYLAMELVDGLPINQYCEQHGTSVETRLRLLVEVCSAVQYAHQRLVIHRDIKPSNILVTPDGVPKLLDFGIAKLLESTAGPGNPQETAAVVRLFTRTYASPEQINGAQITTASDVYSLGVVLFELLSGGVPQQSHPMGTPTFTLKAPARTVAPLTRRQAIDLDNIVRMATHADPSRRYASVEQFAADLQRHLDVQPIMARRDSLRYRASMFVARHTPAVALASAAVLALTLTMAAALHEARVARAERARSERRFNDARQLANSLMTEIYGAVKDLPGATPARRLLVDKALQYLDGLSRDAVGDAALEGELATAYALVGDVQGNPYYPNLGDPRGALESYRKSLAIRARLAAASPGDPQLIRRLSGSYNQLGAALTGLGDFKGALESFQSALRMLLPVAEYSRDAATLDQLAGAWFYVAGAAERTGDLDLAVDSIRHATAVRDTITASDPKQARDIETHRAGDHARAAAILEEKLLLPDAVAEQARAASILAALAGQQPENATIRSFLGKAYDGLGRMQEKTGHVAEAEQSFRSATQVHENQLSTDPKNAFTRQNLSDEYRHLGKLQLAQGALTPGMDSLKKALTVLEPLASADPNNTDLRASFADIYFGLGSGTESQARLESALSQRRGELRRACDWYRRSAEVWVDLGNRHLLDASRLDQPEEAARARAACEAELAHQG